MAKNVSMKSANFWTIYVFITLHLLCNVFVACVNFTVGIICSNSSVSSNLGFQRSAAAFSIAIEEFSQDLIPGHHIRYKTYFSNDGLDSTEQVIKMVLNDKVDLVLGHPSSRGNIPVAYVTSRFNTPHISWSAIDVTFSDKSLFRTLVRTTGPMDRVGGAVLALMDTWNWKQMGVFSNDIGICLYITNGLVDAVQANPKFIISTYIEFRDGVTDRDIINYLTTLKRTVRIIIMCSNDDFRRIMMHACALDMCNGEYVFIDPYSLSGDAEYTPWKNNDNDDDKAREAFKHVIKISQAWWIDEPTRLKREYLLQNVPLKMVDFPWFNSEAYDRNITGSVRVGYLYDAGILWLNWLNYSLTNNYDYRDGLALFEFTNNISFKGSSGWVYFDGNGDRVQTYWIQDFKNNTGISRILGIIDVQESKKMVVNLWHDPLWQTVNGLPPVDVPVCGFDGMGCPKTRYNYVPILLGIGIPLIAGILLAFVVNFFVKKRMYESDLQKMLWLIDYKELDIAKTRGSLRSKISIMSSRADIFHNEETNSSILTAVYKGSVVVVKQAKTECITLTRQDFVELKCMKEMNHDNINAFIGACITTPHCCTVHAYCSKGSLMDVLENDDIKLDWMFKLSMISDCVEGLLYIHESKLRSFGRLKSPNCLVDNRWMLKLTDYGLWPFHSTDDYKDLYEEEKHKTLLWTAPEILRCPSPPRNGTQCGDVYSLGIILHEIYFRSGVFPVDDTTAEDIIKGVKTSKLRPTIIKSMENNSKSFFIDLMKQCWDEDPLCRPSLPHVKDIIKRDNKGQKTGIMDNMIAMLEKYANNLEDIVQSRTKELAEEKLKTETLLFRMLPRSVAEKLKIGEVVEPEAFEIVTIFFSDIVGFTNISAASTPMQVVDLLNDLYTVFDDIISSYDVYKVETIGDAYMVVGGLSKADNNRHATEIADLSLTILKSMPQFKIRHRPEDKLVVRIGLHSGSCCAGVVGLTMPRYCLFGDTVNTASRMESNGEGNRIHISATTHQILELTRGYCMEARGEMQIKGKGKMMTYWLLNKANEDCFRNDNTKLDIY